MSEVRGQRTLQEDSHGRAVAWAAMIVLAMYHPCSCLLGWEEVNKLQYTSNNGFYSEHRSSCII